MEKVKEKKKQKKKENGMGYRPYSFLRF